MKTGRLFWGVFLLSLGVLLLGDRLHLFTVPWYWTWRLWPLLLLFWGITLIVGTPMVKKVAAGLVAAGLAFVIVSLVNLSWTDGFCCEEGTIVESSLATPYDSKVTRASFGLESGAGKFVLRDTTSSLVAAWTKSSLGAYELTRLDGTDEPEVKLSLEGKRGGFSFRRMNNSAEVRLHPAPVWDLYLRAGAAKIDWDVRGFKVETVDIDAGAVTMTLALGDLVPETRVKIDGGASSITVRIPESSGCELKLDAPLSGKKLEGLSKVEKGLYRTDNFEGAKHKVYMDVDVGVSRIRVQRD